MPTPLEKFAACQSEEAFRRLVDEFGGLVFASALRRTGDSSMAEEVTQSVFTILASKAAKLTRHTSLSGWLFTTTKLESSKAMRARKRHARKMEALAEELKSGELEPSRDEENWREAVPLLDDSMDRLPKTERELLLARFFEDRSFKDIAQETGSSEAACKMRVKRTLTKLNRWLGAKGITLSVTTLGAALSAELTKAAPAAVTAALPAKAIATAAGSAAGGSTLVTNLLNTMNAMKTSAAAAAAVLAIGSVPVIIQQSDAEDLQRELTSLEIQKTNVPPAGSPGESSGERTKRAGSQGTEVSGTPIQRLLSMARAPVSGEELMGTIYNAMHEQDMTGMLLSYVPLAKLSEAELQKLIAEVETSKKHLQAKPKALQLLNGLSQAVETDPGGVLDRNLASGLNPMNMTQGLEKWATKDPKAALAWFRKNQKEGTLHGKGIQDSAEQYLAASLAAALAKSDPDQAIAIAGEVEPSSRSAVLDRLAAEFAKQGEAGRARTRAMLESTTKTSDRFRIIGSAVRSMVRADQQDEVFGFLQPMELNSSEYAVALAATTNSFNNSRPLPARMDWILEHAPEEVRAQAIESAIGRLHWSERTATTRWIDDLPPGTDRDTALSAEANAMLGGRDQASALERALLIGDAQKRERSVSHVLQVWQRNDRASAEEAAHEAGLQLPPQTN